MAIGTPVQLLFPTNDNGARPTRIVSNVSDWLPVNDDPLTADNSGSPVVSPNAIATDTRHWCEVQGGCSVVELCVRYITASAGTPTNPVVNVFGRDGNSVPRTLRDGNNDTSIELPIDVATDVQDGTLYSYSTPVVVDVRGLREFLVTIETAFNLAAGDETDCAIMARGV